MDTNAQGSKGEAAPEEIREQIARIFASTQFVNAGRQRRFLQFIVDKVLAGAGDEIKEYSIALEVYDRKPDYDPKTDSIVRVEAARVRTRLKEYYEAEGAGDPVVVELPKGAYVPSFHKVRAAVATVGAEPAKDPVSEEVPPVPRKINSRWLVAAGALLAASALAGIGRWYSTRPLQTINVVAFTNLLQDPLGDAFARGLAKEIESQFTQSGRLKVVAAPKGIGSAELALEGTIRDDGGQRRVVAQLLSSKDGGYIWSRVFHDSSATMLAGQEELAKEISHEVEHQAVQFGAEVTAAGTPRARAIQLYRSARGLPRLDSDQMLQRGLAGIERLELSELNRAISLLEQSVANDPQFAPAYSSLASYYQVAAEYDERMLKKAREAAEKAIRLEPNMGEAHAILGYIHFFSDWDIAAAAKEFQLSLEFEPRILTSHRLCADALAILGRHDEALALLDRARAVYPNHPVIETSVAVAHFNAGRFSKMETVARENTKRFPSFPLSHWALGLALEQNGRQAEAIAEEKACLKMSPREGRCMAALGYMYARAGMRDEANGIIAQFRARSANQLRATYIQGLIYNGLGDTEQAYAGLEAAMASHEGDFPYSQVEPRFANLRSQARFQALLKKAGLRF